VRIEVGVVELGEGQLRLIGADSPDADLDGLAGPQSVVLGFGVVQRLFLPATTVGRSGGPS
jgi:hypothetical protein